MHLLRNYRDVGFSNTSGGFRGTGRVWQFQRWNGSPGSREASPVMFPAWRHNRWQVNTSLSWEMQSGRTGLSLTFHNSPDVLERTAHRDRTCFVRTVILVEFSDAQVELSLQTSDAGFVGMLKHTETTYQCYLSRCSYLQPQPLKGTQTPFQPPRETQNGVIFWNSCLFEHTLHHSVNLHPGCTERRVLCIWLAFDSSTNHHPQRQKISFPSSAFLKIILHTQIKPVFLWLQDAAPSLNPQEPQNTHREITDRNYCWKIPQKEFCPC